MTEIENENEYEDQEEEDEEDDDETVDAEELLGIIAHLIEQARNDRSTRQDSLLIAIANLAQEQPTIESAQIEQLYSANDSMALWTLGSQANEIGVGVIEE